jgi:hypothetical protein
MLLGVAAVGWSIYLLAKKIHSPLACGISWYQRAWNSFKK